MITNHPRTFFASINSVNGFFSNFQTIFDPKSLNCIYILKGGPGTGKSSFMKAIAEEAALQGLTVDRFLCSSDPNSLDGIIILEKGVAILDGTSPHTTDPKYPGVVENIINLGSFWNSKKLSKNKTEILTLIKDKNRYFKRAYQFLSAYGEIISEIVSLTNANILYEKMMQNIKRQSTKCFQKDASFEEKQRNISTISKNGYTKIDSFEKMSETIWVIEDHLFSSNIYLKALYDLAVSSKQPIWKSTSPELPQYPNALYFPETKSCFIIGNRDYENEVAGKEYHYINMKRFLDMDSIGQSKQKIRFGQKCMMMLLNGAESAFSDAGKAHERLEKFYIGAMDFQKTDEIKKEVLMAIFD